METCPETQRLLDWLNGKLAIKADLIGRHVEQCADCLSRLEALTDERSLRPTDTPDSNDATFTNEPHFRLLRAKLSEQAAAVRLSEQRPPHTKTPTDEPFKGPFNIADDATNAVSTPGVTPAVETLNQFPASTLKANVARDGNLRNESNVETSQRIEISGYRIETLIGRGGFAHVYQAWDQRLSRAVAIKILDTDRINVRNRHRFLREAKTASSIESPHVVRVMTSGETDDGRPYIVMELVQGLSLARWIEAANDNQQLDLDKLNAGVRLLIQACRGTQAVHDAGLIHRDIKPGNLFVDPQTGAAKLGDFGLARIIDDDTVTLTRIAELVGTPAYMSPEQTKPATNQVSLAEKSDDNEGSNARGIETQLTARSDVYSLGATMYHVLTGQAPFRGSTLSIIMQTNNHAPLPPRQLNEFVSHNLETICLKALEKEPLRRYASAAELGDDLQRAINGQPIIARPLSSLQRLSRWAKLNRGLAIALGLLLLTLISAATISTALLFRATAAEQQAQVDRTSALASLEQAEQDRSAVLATLNSLLGELYTEIGAERGASTKQRQALIDAAIVGLNSIANVEGDRRADRTSMLLHRRLGNLMELTGDQEQAERSLQTVIKIARELYAADPDSNFAAFDLAQMLGDLASHYNLLNYNFETSRELNSEAELLIRSILARDPNYQGAWGQLIKLHENRWDGLHFQMAFTKIIEQSTDVLADLDQYLKTSDSGRKSLVKAHKIEFKIGRAHFQLNNYSSALEFYGRARKYLEQAIESAPTDQKLLEHQAVLDRVESLVCVELSDNERSLELVQRSLQRLEQIAADDPTDVSKQSQLAATYGMQYQPLFALGRYAEAIETLDEAIRISQVLLELTPMDSGLLGNQAFNHRKRAFVLMQINDWELALEAFDDVIRHINDPNHNRVAEADWDFVINNTHDHIQAIKLLLFDAHERPSDITPDQKFMVIAYLVRKEAMSAVEDELSEEAIAILKNLDPDIPAESFTELFEFINAMEGLTEQIQAYRLSLESRVCALRAENLSPLVDRRSEQDELIDQSLRLLKPLVALKPEYRKVLLDNEPDFNWLRTTESFQNSSLNSGSGQ